MTVESGLLHLYEDLALLGSRPLCLSKVQPLSRVALAVFDEDGAPGSRERGREGDEVSVQGCRGAEGALPYIWGIVASVL